MVDYQATKPIQHGGNQSAIRARLEARQPTADRLLGPAQRAGAAPWGPIAAVREATEIDRPLPRTRLTPPGRASCPTYPRCAHRPDHRRRGDNRTDQPDRPGLPRVAGSPWPASWGDPAVPLVAPGPSRLTANTGGLRRKTACIHQGSGTSISWAGTRTTKPDGAAGLFWTGHPNNPTGRAWDREPLARPDRPQPLR